MFETGFLRPANYVLVCRLIKKSRFPEKFSFASLNWIGGKGEKEEKPDKLTHLEKEESRRV